MDTTCAGLKRNSDDLVFDEIYASIMAFVEHAQQPYIKGLMPK